MSAKTGSGRREFVRNAALAIGAATGGGLAHEAECGHHYARVMSAWSGFIALSGFHYYGPMQAVTVVPHIQVDPFQCFWSTATGWGMFSIEGGQLTIWTIEGVLAVRSCEFRAGARKPFASIGGAEYDVARRGDRVVIEFWDPVSIPPGTLRVGVRP
jgi:hypothetical protein